MKSLWSFFVAVTLCLPVHAITLQSAEWFIDTDPGEGSGTAFTGFSGGTADLNLTIPAGTTNALSEGVHLLGVRFQDSDDAWGQVVWRSFLNQHPHGGLAAGEFFFNSDPGPGAGTPLPGVSGNSLSADFVTSLSALPAGANLMGMRFQDGDGEWGQTVYRVFCNPEGGSRALNRVEFIVYRSGTAISSGTVLGDGSLALNLSHSPTSLVPLLGETLLLEVQVVDESGRHSHKVFREVPVQEFSASFQDLFFTTVEQSDPAISGDDADADADGLKNIVEQAMGLHPLEPNASGETIDLDQTPGGMEFSFRSASESVFDPATSTFTLGGLRFGIEMTTNLSSWSGATAPGDFTVSTSGMGQGDGSFRHVIDLANGGPTKRFYRIKVTRD